MFNQSSNRPNKEKDKESNKEIILKILRLNNSNSINKSNRSNSRMK